MRMSKIVPTERLKGADENIWLEVTALVAEHKPVNVGQGFPDFSPPQLVMDAIKDATSGEDILHQYTRGYGHPRLVQAIFQIFGPLFGRDIDAQKEILVTSGAYGSLFCAIQAFVQQGDEVIIVEPFFDCYQTMVKVAGGTPKFIPLLPSSVDFGNESVSGNWTLNFKELKDMFNDKTKAIILNTPNNPLGKVFTKDELQKIANLCIKHDCLCISDEVYEWIIYDQHKHVRIGSLPGMWERTITIGSAGKTFSVTGWRLGWSIGSNSLLEHLRTVWQNSFHNCATVIQEAVAVCLEKEISVFGQSESYFSSLPIKLKRKRDALAKILKEVGFLPIIPSGGYFMLADVSKADVDLKNFGKSSDSWDNKLVKWLITKKNVATIPASVFFNEEHKGFGEKYIRFCFAKQDDTLNKMAEIFKEWVKSIKKAA